MVTQRIMLSCAMAALLAGGSVAFAQDVEISDDLTTPQSTPSTGSFTIVEGGSISVTDLDAVTVDTDSDVTMNGTLIVDGEADDLAVIRLIGDRTLDISTTGDFFLTSELEVGDDENPVDYPNGRFGIVLDPGGSLTGDIFFDGSTAITVEGDNGGGVVLQGDLTGNYVQVGDITLDGDQSVGVGLTNVTGDVQFDINSAIFVTGVESDVITVSDDIDGNFFYGGVSTVTAYTDLTRDPDTDEDVDPQDENNDLQATLVSGNGVSLLGDVTGGILIDGVVDRESTLDDDEETTAGQSTDSSIEVFGSGNALLVGNDSTVSTIGALPDEVGLSDDYGSWSIINRGRLTAQGIYSGVTTEVVRIENVTTTEGIRNSGDIAGLSFEADSVGFRITGNSNIPEFFIEQDIGAGVSGSGGNATAILIDENVTLPVINNDGNNSTISAIASDGESVAIRDLSGSVTSFTNSGTVSATVGDDEDDSDVDVTIALDFAANTSGITLTNTVPDSFNPDEDDNTQFGLIVGDVLTGSGDDVFTSDAGVIVGDVFLGGGNDTYQISGGADFSGDFSTGTGNDNVAFSAFTGEGQGSFGTGNDTFRLSDEASWSGDLFFGAGSDVFELSGLSTWEGVLNNSGDLSISVDNSTFTLSNTEQVSITSLSVDNGGTLTFSLNSESDDTARILASGNVSIDETSAIAFSTVEGFSGTIENRLITAGNLDIDVSAIDVDSAASSSFLVEETLVLDPNNANSLILRRRRRNADEVGIEPEKQAAFEPALTAIEADETLTTALYATSTEEEFLDLYGQLMPEPLDLALVSVRAHNNAMNSILRHRTLREGEGVRLGRRQAWLKQELYYVNRTEGRGSDGFNGYGLVIAGGYDRKVPGLDVLGIAASLATTQLEEKLGDDFPVTRTTTAFDIYGAKSMGRFTVDGRVGYGWASSDSERNISFDEERRDFDASWDGTQLTGNARVQYFHKLGGIDIIPTLSVDYIDYTEDGYTEENLDDSVAFSAEDREGESMRLNTGLNVGWVREHRARNDFTAVNAAGPLTAQTRFTVSAGYSQELQGDPLTGTYRFNDGEAFTLEMDQEDTGYYVGGDLTYRNGFMRFSTGFNGTFGEETVIGSAFISVGIDW